MAAFLPVGFAYSNRLDSAATVPNYLRQQRPICSRRAEPDLLPPRRLVTLVMQLAMMASTKRDRELITDLPAKSAVLCKAQMMGVARLSSADQAGLLGHKPHMIAIANAPSLKMG